MAGNTLAERQYDGNYPPFDNGSSDSWFWSSTGIAVRYSIAGAVLLLIFLYFVGGYFHARSRMRKGLQPMAYHRWMVRKQMYHAAAHPYARHWPQYGAQAEYASDAYGNVMPRHAYPPPAYNADQAPPPVYPDGGEGGKIAADQRYAGSTHREGGSNVENALPSVPPLAIR